MATTTILPSEIKDIHVSDAAGIQHAKMAQRPNAVIAIPFTDARVWDALATVLPGTPATDDLGLVTGTWGTDAPYIGTGDLKAAGATTRRFGIFFPVPEDFEDANTVTVRLYAGMKTTVADTSATIDVELYRLDKDGTLGAADLITTAATTINSLSIAAKDFVITPDTIVKGDMLHARVSITVTDGATVTAVIGGVWAIELLADLR
jgi:hypothetical protein